MTTATATLTRQGRSLEIAKTAQATQAQAAMVLRGRLFKQGFYQFLSQLPFRRSHIGFWSIVYTKCNHERAIIQSIVSDLSIYLPLQPPSPSRHANRVTQTQHPALPGFMFLWTNTKACYDHKLALLRTNSVSQIVTPTPVQQRSLEDDLIKLDRILQCSQVKLKPISPGGWVEITAPHPLQGLRARLLAIQPIQPSGLQTCALDIRLLGAAEFTIDVSYLKAA